MKKLFASCFLIISLLGNISSQDLKVSLDQTHAKWLDSKFVGDKFLIQCYIPEQKAIPTDSLPIVFVLDADMSFGLVYDIVRWLNWGREIPYVAIVYTSICTLDNEDVKTPWIEFVNQVKSRKYKGLTLDTGVVENEDHLSMLPSAVTRGLRTIFNAK